MVSIRAMSFAVTALVVLAAWVSARPVAAGVKQSQVPGQEVALRSTLAELLTEHGGLALLAGQKAYLDAPDLPAVVAQLERNTMALTGGVRTLYGDEPADSFMTLWHAHNHALVQYAMGVRMGDSQMQQQALAVIAAYVEGIPTIIASVNPFLSREALVRDFTVHANHLQMGVDSFAVGDYELTYTIHHEEHHHMIMQANVLADAIIQQFPELFGR